MCTVVSRPAFIDFNNGEKTQLPFTPSEYQNRLTVLRDALTANNIDVVVFTSMQCIAYYSGFLYCSFGRAYACIVTQDRCVTVSANIDGGQPWRRSIAENVVYTDWQQGNHWRAVQQVVGTHNSIGIEYDHMTIAMHRSIAEIFPAAQLHDITTLAMIQRLVKSDQEIELIKAGARIADLGGDAIRKAIQPGARELDIAMAGRNAMEIEIAHSFPSSELRDTWAWFQSGINTDGAHNPVTTRKVEYGDILSLNTFPMINAYYTALERTLFMGEPDKHSLKIWSANVEAHKLGLSLIKPGACCADICCTINNFFEERDLLQFRSFGYGAFVRDTVALLWSRGRTGIARRCIYLVRTGHGGVYGTHADRTRDNARCRRLPRT